MYQQIVVTAWWHGQAELTHVVALVPWHGPATVEVLTVSQRPGRGEGDIVSLLGNPSPLARQAADLAVWLATVPPTGRTTIMRQTILDNARSLRQTAYQLVVAVQGEPFQVVHLDDLVRELAEESAEEAIIA